MPESVSEALGGFSLPPLLRFADLAVEMLAESREEIDALNVYPVPDGDTGTNLFLTFEAAQEALRAKVEERGGPDRAALADAFVAYDRGLLLGARGNSGVIMSQLVGALLRSIAASRAEDRAAAVFARGMVAATEASYAAVGEPVEGTILTVARAAADEAVRAAGDPQNRTEQVLGASVAAARTALEHTTEQLEVLRRAGVVDAGGLGLCRVLEAAHAAYTGHREPKPPPHRRPRHTPATLPTDDLTEGGPAYEVMYLLEAEDSAIPPLRRALAPLGDSLVVVGGEGMWNVHVHVDDVGAAVEAGIEAGRPHRIRVTHFAEQRTRAQERRRASEPEARGVVAVAFGPGLAAVLEQAGARVVEAGVTRKPSTGDLVEAIRATGAAEVVVLPNDRDVLPTAEAASRVAEEEHDLRVEVIPTTAQVQGMAALAVHDPGRSFAQDLVEMAAAARHARSGAVTVAAREAMTSAGPCRPGDVLGAVEGDFALIGTDLEEVARQVVDRLLGGGGELVTLLAGKDSGDLAQRCAEYLAGAYPSVDVLTYDGGQERYPLLVGVE